MRGTTHLAGGILASVIIGHTNAVIPFVVGAAISGMAALAPDWINVAVPGLHVHGATGHRGFTHWALMLVMTSAVAWIIAPGWWLFWAAGYASHLLLDMLTTRGVPVFWPSPAISLLPIKEGGAFDHWLGAALVVIAIIMVLVR